MEIKHCIVQKKNVGPLIILVGKYPRPIRDMFKTDEDFYESNIAWREKLEKYPYKNEEEWMEFIYDECCLETPNKPLDEYAKNLSEGISINPNKVKIKEEKIFGIDVSKKIDEMDKPFMTTLFYIEIIK